MLVTVKVSPPIVSCPLTAPGCVGAKFSVKFWEPPACSVNGSAGRLLSESPWPVTAMVETCPSAVPVFEMVTTTLEVCPTAVAAIAMVPPADTVVVVVPAAHV